MNTRNNTMRDRSGDSTGVRSGDKSVKRCLRSRQLKTSEYRQYLDSISKRSNKTKQSNGQSFNRQPISVNKPKRGRGRPPKVIINKSSARVVEQNNGIPVVTIDNTLAEGLPTNLEIFESFEENVVQNGVNCSLTIDTINDTPIDTPPELQQFCTEFGMNYLTDGGIYSPISSTTDQRSVSPIVNSGQKCSLYVDLCKQLTQRIESEFKDLDESNLMAALKYCLLRCNSADIDVTIDCIKNASRDITVGVSYDINNQRMIRTRVETQTNDNKTNWSGTVYTPQLKHEYK